MIKTIKNISVIGDGGWGTTLSIYLAGKGYLVKLWGPFPEYVRQMQKSRKNEKFLPGFTIPKSVELTERLDQALTADLVVFAVPSKYFAGVLAQTKKVKVPIHQKIFLSVTKGIDTKRLERMSTLIHQSLGKNLHLAVLSGPNIAREVVAGVPSTAVVASSNLKVAQTVQKVFNSETFRIYTNTDIIGVELGGSLKNVIAIACGVCDGLGFGTNTKAAILTRGLAEMARLGKAMGAREETFYGLSGLGDLATTSFNPQSRNRSVGEKLGQGKSFSSIVKGMEMVAEGVDTVKAVYHLSRKLHVPMPISNEIYNIIYKAKSPQRAVHNLMKRSLKAE